MASAKSNSDSSGSGMTTMMIKVGAALAVGGLAAYAYKESDVDLQQVVEYGKAQMDNLETILMDLGNYGPLLLFVVYIVASVFLLPLWGFHMVTAYVYGTAFSSIFVTTTQSIAAMCSMTWSRYVVGKYVRNFLIQKYGKKFHAIDAAISKEGFKVTLLLRLSPLIPFGMNNYIAGISSELSVFTFGAATWFGVLPGTSLSCYLATVGKQLAEEGSEGAASTPLQKVVMGMGIVAGLAVVKIVSDLATNALKEAGIDDGDGEDDDDNNNKINKKKKA